MARYSFNTDLAYAYGIERAVILEGITYFQALNQTRGEHFYDGYTWVVMTTRSLAERYGFIDDIHFIINKMVENGLIIAGRFANENRKEILLRVNEEMIDRAKRDIQTIRSGVVVNGAETKNPAV